MRQIRRLEYEVHDVTSLADLLDMMRYDGMRLKSTDNLMALSQRDCGIVNKDFPPGGFTITLVKDQGKEWQPTVDRWQSFGMRIYNSLSWSRAATI